MANLSSEAVQLVYPSIKRDSANAGNTYRASRVSTEQNLCRFTGQFLDNDYFVISKEVNLNGIFEFNIKGYYFRVTTQGLLAAAGEGAQEVSVSLADIKAANNDAPVFQYGELQGDDTDGYTGLVIYGDTSGMYLLLEKDDGGNWKIPDSAKQVFNWERVDFNITAIDCGEITQ